MIGQESKLKTGRHELFAFLCLINFPLLDLVVFRIFFFRFIPQHINSSNPFSNAAKAN